MSLWNDPEFLGVLAKWAPYVFIILGSVLAMSGLWVRSKVDDRVEALQHRETQERKRIPPSVSAFIAKSEATGDLLVVMDAQNTTPFRTRWTVVTKDDRIVSGIMIEDVEIHPTEDRKRFSSKLNLHTESIVDGYVELRFRYVSLYSAELGDPAELSREVRQTFRLVDGNVFPTSVAGSSERDPP